MPLIPAVSKSGTALIALLWQHTWAYPTLEGWSKDIQRFRSVQFPPLRCMASRAMWRRRTVSWTWWSRCGCFENPMGSEHREVVAAWFDCSSIQHLLVELPAIPYKWLQFCAAKRLIIHPWIGDFWSSIHIFPLIGTHTSSIRIPSMGRMTMAIISFWPCFDHGSNSSGRDFGFNRLYCRYTWTWVKFLGSTEAQVSLLCLCVFVPSFDFYSPHHVGLFIIKKLPNIKPGLLWNLDVSWLFYKLIYIYIAMGHGQPKVF